MHRPDKPKICPDSRVYVDAEHLGKFRPSAYGLVICTNVFEHLSRPETAFRSMVASITVWLALSHRSLFEINHGQPWTYLHLLCMVRVCARRRPLHTPDWRPWQSQQKHLRSLQTGRAEITLCRATQCNRFEVFCAPQTKRLRTEPTDYALNRHRKLSEIMVQ